MADATVARKADEGQAYWMLGGLYVVKVSSEETGGAATVMEMTMPAGMGPPPHTHPWDESFYVVGGRIDFGIGGESLTATAGTLVHLPAGTVHWFRFGAGGGEMVSMTSRLGASKLFEDMAREISPTNPDLAKLTEVGARHGLTVAG